MAVFVRYLNPILMILFGLGAGIYLARRYKLDWHLYGIGALTFIGSQVLHLPFNYWALNPLLARAGIMAAPQGFNLVILGVALGLSAGVFEEVARYVVFRRWLPLNQTWRESLMFGAGHGGIEAVLLGGLVFYTVVQMVMLRSADLSQVVPPEQLGLAQAQVRIFWALPWYAVLLGALERCAALALHLGATVLVLQAVQRRELRWLGAAVGWHALVDAAAVIGVSVWGMYVTEGLLLLFGGLSLGLVWLLRAEPPAPVPLPPPAPFQIHPAEFSENRIEESRYAE